MVLRRYALVLCTLALAFTLVLGIARAKENSDRMRTGRSADVIDAADVKAFVSDAWHAALELFAQKSSSSETGMNCFLYVDKDVPASPFRRLM